MNKQVQFNLGLDEIKKMTPEEGYFFEKRVVQAIEYTRQNGI